MEDENKKLFGVTGSIEDEDFAPASQYTKMNVGDSLTYEIMEVKPKLIDGKDLKGNDQVTPVLLVKDVNTKVEESLWLGGASIRRAMARIHDGNKSFKGLIIKIVKGEYDHPQYGKKSSYAVTVVKD